MGIRGLTTFIAEGSDLYLKPFRLKDSYLIVDGNCAAYYLFTWHTKDSGIFGGDYDVYYETVRKFFKSLLTCNVTPIVIFDGGHEKEKLKTVYERHSSRLIRLSRIHQPLATDKFIPLFLMNIFQYTIREMNITCVQCFFEADREIAATAKMLNCPVLSYDSDFFIHDVLYIPFNTLTLQPKQIEILDSHKFFLKCSIFMVDDFLKHFEGLKKCMLPFIPVLLGNDYIDNSIFNKLFNHISIPKSKSKNYLQKKILAVLNWLKHEESVESAKNLILTHLKKYMSTDAAKAILTTVHHYNNYSCTIMSHLNVNIKTNKKNNHKECGQNQKKECEIKKKDLISKLPHEFIRIYQECKIQSFVMDMIFLNCYFVPTQVEDLNENSSHTLSFPIIGIIHTIMKNILFGNNTLKKNTLKLHLKSNNDYITMHLKNFYFNCFVGINFNNLLSEANIVKRNFFYQALNLNENDVTILGNFDNDWILFIISFIYWIKNLDLEISNASVHALLFAVLCNFVQNIVGYYKDYSTFMSYKSKLINNLSKEKVLTYNYSNWKLSEFLNHISNLELLIFTKSFIKLRKINNNIKKNYYFISVLICSHILIHLYACFQSCLFHALQVSISNLNNNIRPTNLFIGVKYKRFKKRKK